MKTKAVESVNEVQRDLWRAIHETADLLSRCEEPTFAETGVSSQQCIVLMTIAQSDAPLTITGLARRLHRNLNSMSAIVDRMERNHLVKRMRGSNSGKASRVQLTTTGSRITDLAREQQAKLIRRLLGQSSPQQLQACLSLLNGIASELSRMSEQRRKRMSGWPGTG